MSPGLGQPSGAYGKPSPEVKGNTGFGFSFTTDLQTILPLGVLFSEDSFSCRELQNQEICQHLKNPDRFKWTILPYTFTLIWIYVHVESLPWIKFKIYWSHFHIHHSIQSYITLFYCSLGKRASLSCRPLNDKVMQNSPNWKKLKFATQTNLTADSCKSYETTKRTAHLVFTAIRQIICSNWTENDTGILKIGMHAQSKPARATAIQF